MELPGLLPTSLAVIDKKIVKCSACPRLVKWREEVAITKRKSYRDEKYWGRPVT
ncbi:MAG: uracil-DNA glycosylase, partial [Actinomycetota bacterium]